MGAPIDCGLAGIRARLGGREPHRHTGPVERRAAIAAVLRPAGPGQAPLDTELLLIRRAEREGDPWSGHMAMPGGHIHPSDSDLLATAMRETLEEVGLDLREHELIGPLDEHFATARGHFIGLVIAPFVFALRHDAPLRPNYEVADYTWASLGQMARGEIDGIQEVAREGELMRFPGYRVGEQLVWGLTHRVLQNLFETLK
jgi:8-oxo-dGTP pyrophosphatase MutT (NUDIX family)